MKLDQDLLAMTEAELRREVMKLRTAFRKELNYTGNHRCWVNILKPLPEGGVVKPLSLPREEFIGNCCRYYDRNQPND